VGYALRGLRKSPGFTSVAVLTLAFGSAATISIFSLVDSALLKPLTYQDADRLYVIHEVNRRSVEMPLIPVNATHFQEWQRSVAAFEQMALVGNASLNLTGSGEPERLPAGRVSPNLFAMLGAHLQLGRAFTSDEDQPGRDRVVVLNPELWRLRFNADRAIIGRRITLNGERMRSSECSETISAFQSSVSFIR
jgi:putative ABC transport system permease protein